jgi:uncharacterized membrane protein YqjE
MASVPTDHERLSEASIAELLRSLLADTRMLLKGELELAKLELKDTGSDLGVAGGLLGGAVAVALFALGTLIATAVLARATVLPGWAAALIVATVLVMVALLLFLVGRNKMRGAWPPAPRETIENVREDLEWMRREAERLRWTE